jgi:LmbE family N-acetylglucosaminyl deacetylase
MPERIQHVLVIVAHPDDAESQAGGTVAKLAREGKLVAYAVLTNGDKGSGTAESRPSG